MLKTIMPVLLWLLLAQVGMAQGWPVTALIPSKPAIEEPVSGKSAKKDVPAGNEIDMLIALLEPHAHQGVDMEMPQFFGALRYPADFDPAQGQPELVNLLGDVEEIRYLGKKAWGANIDVQKPGLYQFALEARPWWNEERKMYMHQQARVMMPVRGVENGWHLSFGQSFEILPLNRPFGLNSPALFFGRILLDGRPLADIPVHVGRIRAGANAQATQGHRFMEARSDQDGKFAFVLNEPGWWYCETAIKGSPLKGPDGEMRELERSTVFWLYVAEGPGSKPGR